MKANELRIGNLIKGIYHDYDDGIDEEIENETICKVVTLDVSGSGDYPIYVYSDEDIEHFSEFQPIPLTEEWLFKFDFKQQGNRKMWVKGRLCVVYESYLDLSNNPTPKAFYIGFKDLGNVVFHTTLKVDYVHTLQNAFALTGEELTLKQQDL
jgi:hypothetical protein